MDKAHLESQFDPSIVPAIVPIMPGITPHAREAMMGWWNDKGTPWKKQGLAPIEKSAKLESALRAGNPHSAKGLLEAIDKRLVKEGHTSVTGKAGWIENDNSRNQAYKMRGKGWIKSPDGSWYDPKRWKYVNKIDAYGERIGLVELNKQGQMVGGGGGVTIAEGGDLDMKNRTTPKKNIWGKIKGYGSAFIKSPLCKITSAGSKLAAFGGLPLLLAGELDWKNKENYFMPNYEYTPIGGQSTIWEDING